MKNRSTPKKIGHKDLAGSLSKYVEGYEPLEIVRLKIKKKIADKIKHEGLHKNSGED